MGLSKEIEKLSTDKRLTDYYLSRGKISQDEHKKYLASLPDLASNVETLGVPEEASISPGVPTNGEFRMQ